MRPAGAGGHGTNWWRHDTRSDRLRRSMPILDHPTPQPWTCSAVHVVETKWVAGATPAAIMNITVAMWSGAGDVMRTRHHEG